MTRWLLPIIVLLALVMAGPVAAAEPTAKGTIEGQLTNKTPGGAGVANVEVTLKTFQQDKETGSQTAKTDSQGRFGFDGLDTRNTYQVVLKNYQGAEYDGDSLTFTPGQTSLSANMAVYDTTTDGSTIKDDTAHVVMYVQEGSLMVEEYHQISNSANKTYVGTQTVDSQGRKETMRFELPSGASQIEIVGGLEESGLVKVDGGFIDTIAVPPGKKEMSFAYAIPYSGGQYNFSKALALPTGSFNLFVQSLPGLQVKSDQLSYQGSIQAQIGEFSRYGGTNLAPGLVLNASLSGLPAASSQNDLLWVALGAAGVVVAALVAFRLWRSRSPQPVVAMATSQYSTGMDRRQALLVELATLDDNYEAGVVSEAEYQRLRSAMKAELLALMSSG